MTPISTPALLLLHKLYQFDLSAPEPVYPCISGIKEEPEQIPFFDELHAAGYAGYWATKNEGDLRHWMISEEGKKKIIHL